MFDIYDKIFSYFHSLLFKWQPLNLEVFLLAWRISSIKRKPSINVHSNLRKKLNKVNKMPTKTFGEFVAKSKW